MLHRIVCLALMASALYADGGKVLFQSKAGAFQHYAVCAESPVRVGKADLSVMVQNVADESPVLDADVRMRPYAPRL